MIYKHLFTFLFLTLVLLTSTISAWGQDSASRCYFFEPFKHYAQVEGFALKVVETSGVPCFIQQTDDQQWQPYFWFTSEQDLHNKLDLIQSTAQLNCKNLK